MKKEKIVLKNALLYCYSRIHLILFLLSILALTFILFKLIKINIILGTSKVIILEFIFHSIIIFSSIFTLLFLPTYPVFFVLLKEQPFNFLEKLSLTIVINSAFYIFIGYIGYWIGSPLTGFYFFYSVTICFIIVISIIAFKEFKKGSCIFFRTKKPLFNKIQNLDKISLYSYLKNKIPLNGLLLIIFILLICVLNITKFSYFVGTDPWLHILNNRIITEANILPLEGYHGTMGLNIFGAVIHFFSGLNHILVPKFFAFYTFFLSALIFYSISMRIFKNQNLAIFGVFILEFSSLGFSTMMLQYWPSGSALIMSLAIFLLLYVRLQNFIQLQRPSRKEISSNIILTYILITVIFVSSVVTHVVTTIIFLFSYLWLYLIYFLKDYKRGFDFIFLCGLFGIFIILNIFGIGRGHYWFFIPLNLSWYILLLVGISVGLAGGLILWKLKRAMHLTKGLYTSTIKGEKYKIYKKIEDKIIIPFIFSSVTLFTILFLIANLIWLGLAITNVFYVAEILLISSFGVWGLIVFQKEPRGAPLFILGLGFLLLLVAGLVFNLLILSNMIWQRILYLIPPITVIGFISYIYKLIKLNKIKVRHVRFSIIFIIIFSLVSTYFHESVSFKVFTLNKKDVSTIKWYSNNTSGKNVIITEFGWKNVFKYYDFSCQNGSIGFIYEENFYFPSFEIDIFPPSNHINESGINILKEIKNEYNTDVYIIFADDYIINKGFDLFGRLSKEEIDEYYRANYLNKICSSRTENGEEIPIYWVI